MPRFLIFTLVASLCIAPTIVHARDQSNVITDQELTNAQTMSLASIDQFLKSKGALGYRFFADTDGIVRTAAEIIWRVATTHEINPRFLLALIQKEQSLIDDKRPSQDQIDWATGYGVCDRCAKTDPSLQRFRGFAKQVEGAARQIREEYLPRIAATGATLGGFGPGKAKRVDGSVVVPANAATAALYTYTPHLHGNALLATIWDKWFKKKFAYGALLRTEDKLTYLFVDGTLRLIASDKVFRTIGFNPEEIEEVSTEDLIGLQFGESITKRSIYPQGALVQNKKTGGVYFVQNAIKHPIPSREIMQTYFSGRKIFKVAPSELAEYQTGAPMTFEDGTLVGIRGTNDIFLISGGLRHPLRNLDTIASFGWQEEQMIWTTRKAVELHGLGEIIEPLEINN